MAMIPLRLAVGAFVALAVVIGIWTWRATRVTASDGRQVIVFWGSSQIGEEIYTLAHRFEQSHPQYRVELGTAVARDLTGDAQRLLSAVAGGVPPDLVWFDRFAVGEWASRNALTDLTPLLRKQAASDPDRVDLGEYYPWSIEECSYRPPGSSQAPALYGLPISADIRLLWTNRNLLRQEGLVDAQGQPQLPRTWEELRADNRRLSRYRVAGDPASGLTRLGFAPGYGNSWLYIYAFQAGGSLLSPDGTRVTLTSPPISQALHFMCDCYDDIGGVQQANAFQQGFQDGPLDPFLKSQVAMKIDGSWFLDTVAAYAPDDLDWTVSPAPLPAAEVAKGRSPITWAGGFALVIPKTARCPEGAFALMQYLTSWQSVNLLEQSKREKAQGQGLPYIPGLQANRVHYQRLVAQALAGDLATRPRYRDAVLTFQGMLDHTLIRPVSPVGQLLWNMHVQATDQAEQHAARAQAQAQGVDEVDLALAQAQAPVQAQLDRLLHGDRAPAVRWGRYLGGYGFLVALVLAVACYRQATGRYRLRESGAALLFLSPWLLGFTVLIGGPIFFSIVYSFCTYDVLTPAHYAGLDNYREVAADPLFWQSLGNTVFMLLRIPLVMAVGLMIALLLNRGMRGLSLYRTAFYLPAVMPVVAASLLWLWIFNPTQGFLNQALEWGFATLPGHALEAVLGWVHGRPVHLQAPLWLQDPAWSKPAMILMSVWSAGGCMIIWLAGLQGIPSQLYEAAAIDGANSWQRFRHITVPMLSPYILFNLIMGVIATMQIFSEAYIMSDNGKPANSLLFYALYLFDQSFQYFRMGYASAMAWILFLIVLALTALQMWLAKRWVNYDQT